MAPNTPRPCWATSKPFARKERAFQPEPGRSTVAAVALASGVDQQSLYKNPRCRELLEQAAQELGLQAIEARATGPTTKDEAKTQRISVLEAQVATLKAEVEGLRRQLSRYSHIEQHMVETGRRVIP